MCRYVGPYVSPLTRLRLAGNTIENMQGVFGTSPPAGGFVGKVVMASPFHACSSFLPQADCHAAHTHDGAHTRTIDYVCTERSHAPTIARDAMLRHSPDARKTVLTRCHYHHTCLCYLYSTGAVRDATSPRLTSASPIYSPQPPRGGATRGTRARARRRHTHR